MKNEHSDDLVSGNRFNRTRYISRTSNVYGNKLQTVYLAVINEPN